MQDLELLRGRVYELGPGLYEHRLRRWFRGELGSIRLRIYHYTIIFKLMPPLLWGFVH